MIKLIIFDCYGLVLNEGYPNTAKYLAKKYGGNWKNYQKIIYSWFNKAAIKEITQKQAWDNAVKELKLPLKWNEVRDIHYKLMKVDKRIIPLVNELEKRGYKILLLSKNTRSQFADTCRRFNLRKKFKNVINTWELGLPKASKKTLREIMKRFKVTPKEIIYADDQDDNLKDAREMSIKTILVKNFSQFKKELNRFLYAY